MNTIKNWSSKKNMNQYKRSALWSYGITIVGFILISLLDMGGFISNSLRGQLVPICAYIVMAISLNLVVGISGELSLGHAGFMSVGAFSGVIAATLFQSIPFVAVKLLIAIVAGGFFAGIAGVIIGIPVLRLRGDYLAIVTLAFGEIIRNVLNVIYVGMDEDGLHISTAAENIIMTENGSMILNGPMGATGITKMSTFLAGFLLIMFTLFIVMNLINSKQGRAIMAIRDNRIAAESVGLSATNFKMTTFVTGAVLAGMAGALFALNYSTVAPVKFNFNTSILVLVFVVLGGIGNIAGSIISAAVLTILPEALRDFADYRMLTYAVVLILVMLATNNSQIRGMVTLTTEKVRPAFRKGARKEGGR